VSDRFLWYTYLEIRAVNEFVVVTVIFGKIVIDGLSVKCCWADDNRKLHKTTSWRRRWMTADESVRVMGGGGGGRHSAREWTRCGSSSCVDRRWLSVKRSSWRRAWRGLRRWATSRRPSQVVVRRRSDVARCQRRPVTDQHHTVNTA